nr:immunoglobulin heavy chain junction region [Mus musculus]MBK4196240.1 immunoglobulin heavy chain junction region [Mus musculus]
CARSRDDYNYAMDYW